MTENKKAVEFCWGLLPMMLVPYFLLLNQTSPNGMKGAVFLSIAALTGTGFVAFLIKNWRDILSGALGTLFLILILVGLAAIPIVGWIASLAIIVFTLYSAFSAIRSLIPIALKATLMWIVFATLLIADWNHPVYSPVAYCIFCLGVTVRLSSKPDPYGDFLLLISSIPLLIMVIASLGKMFQNSPVFEKIRVGQTVRGYTNIAGKSVNGYVRNVMKDVVVNQTSVNTGTAISNNTIASQAKKDNA